MIVAAKNRIAQSIRSLTNFFKEKLQYLSLKKSIEIPTPEYDHYISAQLKRTIVKNSYTLLPRTRLLINLLVEKGAPAASSKILCVGCRNTAELDHFQTKGLPNTIGIDLLSESPRIQTMDMHHLTFPDNSFDIVYSAHSLEHSYDITQVVGEFIRVARDQALMVIEVPVRFTLTEADRHDMKKVTGLMALFAAAHPQLIWSDDREAGDPENDEGTPIVRVIFRIFK